MCIIPIRKLRTSIHGQILINLSISLVGLYIFFLTGAYLTSIPVLCGISSALLHYFMLVFFGWTVAEAILLYVKLVVIWGTQRIESKFVLKAALATWCKSVSWYIQHVSSFRHPAIYKVLGFISYCGVVIVTISNVYMQWCPW